MERIPDVSARRAVPVEGVVAERQGAGLVLRRRRYRGARAAAGRVFGVSPDRTFKLDPMAGEAWELMDGIRSVGQVRAELAQRHPGEPELGPRLGRLVGLLVSHGFLRLE